MSRKSIKATTKRGKVTRVPSRTKTKSALKSAMGHNIEPYKNAYYDLESRNNKAEMAIEDYKKQIRMIEVSIYGCKIDIEKYIRYRNHCGNDYYDKEYKTELTKEIANYKKRIEGYKKQIKSIRDKIEEKQNIINVNKIMMKSLIPVERYHVYHLKKDFDRAIKYARIRSKGISEPYDGKPMRRK